MRDRNFKREQEEEPFISGHSVSKHLKYMIDKYVKGASLEQARKYCFKIINYEMSEMMKNRGKKDAVMPVPHSKEFLTAVKDEGIKIGRR